MSFDGAPLSVRDAAALAASRAHPAPPADAALDRARVGFVVYLIQHGRRFSDWPVREGVR